MYNCDAASWKLMRPSNQLWPEIGNWRPTRISPQIPSKSPFALLPALASAVFGQEIFVASSRVHDMPQKSSLVWIMALQ
jgi:hypothetical protein